MRKPQPVVERKPIRRPAVPGKSRTLGSKPSGKASMTAVIVSSLVIAAGALGVIVMESGRSGGTRGTAGAAGTVAAATPGTAAAIPSTAADSAAAAGTVRQDAAPVQPAPVEDATGPAPAAAAVAAAVDAPRPYPWQLSDRVRATFEKLLTPISNIQDSDGSMADLIRKFAESAGVELRFEGLDPDSLSRLSFTCVGITALSGLDMVKDMGRLSWTIAEDGAVVVMPAGKAAGNEAFGVLAALKGAQERPTGEEGYPAQVRAADEKWSGWLKTQTVKFTGGSITPAQALERIQQETAAYIGLFSKRNELRGPDAPRIVVAPGENRVDTVLQEIAKACGLAVHVNNGGPALLDPDQDREWSDQRERTLRGIEETLSRRITFAGDRIRGDRLAEAIKAGTGLDAILDESVWSREDLVAPAGERRFDEALGLLGQDNGLQWRLLNGVVYVF